MARVLFVDDEERIAWSSAAYLSAVGHDVTVALTIASARGLLSDSRFDVAVLDVLLPDGSGLDLLAEIRQDHPTLPALVMTGHILPEIADRARQLGAAAVLDKPFHNEALAKLIGSALGTQAEQPADASDEAGEEK